MNHSAPRLASLARLTSLGGVLAFLLAAPTASAQVLFEDDFENGLGAWTATGLWRIELESDPCGSSFLPFPSGDACARCGSPTSCNHFPLGGQGNLTTPTVAIPPLDGLRRPVVRYLYRYDISEFDKGWDCASIRVGATVLGEVWCSEDSGQTAYPPLATWGVGTRDLSAYAGQSIGVTFQFEADTFHNAGPGFLIDDVWLGLVAGTPFCGADTNSFPTPPICPCLVSYDPRPTDDLGGCINSRGLRGDLFAEGLPSIASDSVAIHVAGIKANTTALLVQGTPSATGFTFGDGAWCLGIPIRRLLFQQAVQGKLRFPGPGQASLSVLGGVTPGQTVGYQVYYRDQSPTHCTPDRWNVTNGFEVTWAP